VEAGSNTSTVALRVVGDERGSRCEGVQLGHPLHGGKAEPPCSCGIKIWGPGPTGWGSLESETVK
jgi:hypothetical protein